MLPFSSENNLFLFPRETFDRVLRCNASVAFQFVREAGTGGGPAPPPRQFASARPNAKSSREVVVRLPSRQRQGGTQNKSGRERAGRPALSNREGEVIVVVIVSCATGRLCPPFAEVRPHCWKRSGSKPKQRRQSLWARRPRHEGSDVGPGGIFGVRRIVQVQGVLRGIGDPDCGAHPHNCTSGQSNAVRRRHFEAVYRFINVEGPGGSVGA